MISPTQLLHQMPGRVWSFTGIEAHCLGHAYRTLKQFLPDDTHHTAEDFGKVVESAGLQTTVSHDWYVFIGGFIAAARAEVWKGQPDDEVEIARTSFETEACGHTNAEHDDVITGWYQRNVVAGMEWIYTMELLEAFARIDAADPGLVKLEKPIIARPDMERQIDAYVASTLELVKFENRGNIPVDELRAEQRASYDADFRIIN